MLDFSEWTPMKPSEGPPLPSTWLIKWPDPEDMYFMKPQEGPPLPRGFKIEWPWAKEQVNA